MPAITTIHQSLPYIDPEPTPAERAAAEALIAAERALVPDDPDHALLPPAHQPRHTPVLQAELDRLSAHFTAHPDPATRPAPPKILAVDFSRYEALDADDVLLTPSGLAAVPAADAKQQLSAALARAYAAHEYVRGRRQHLALLESLGKNAWLVGNWQLEGEVRALERELGDAKRSVDLAAARRRAAQEAIAGELRGLEETWKKGVARVVETEAAAEVLRREVLEARRRNAKLID